MTSIDNLKHPRHFRWTVLNGQLFSHFMRDDGTADYVHVLDVPGMHNAHSIGGVEAAKIVREFLGRQYFRWRDAEKEKPAVHLCEREYEDSEELLFVETDGRLTVGFFRNDCITGDPEDGTFRDADFASVRLVEKWCYRTELLPKSDIPNPTSKNPAH